MGHLCKEYSDWSTSWEKSEYPAVAADLREVYKWASFNEMGFSADKFELVRYRAGQQQQGADVGVKRTFSYVCDLGFTLSRDATFNGISLQKFLL